MSFNLSNVSSASKILFTLIYENPYINLYIKSYDSSNNLILNGEGYVNYLGELESVPNTNFRLYLHPFINTTYLFGSTSLIKNLIKI